MILRECRILNIGHNASTRHEVERGGKGISVQERKCYGTHRRGFEDRETKGKMEPSGERVERIKTKGWSAQELGQGRVCGHRISRRAGFWQESPQCYS